MISGVCGGIAKYFGIDPVIVRIIAVLLVFASGAGFIAYIILAILVPLESSGVNEPRDVTDDNVEEIKQKMKAGQRGRNVLGIILVIVGILFLLASFRFFWWLRWTYLWPLVLIAIGLLIIFGSRRK